ncbi:hypothetical protein Q8F55_001040 [Vanrija albida]|uniref:Major facilitator superfamily (MFS) profile domain-containing protein n=1 Tax=Vanrija albida TaxID=181172 RepID=A0ABR3QEZ0_9TREE
MGAKRDKIETLFWGKPPADPKERKLLVKLDLVILSYVCLSYWINYVDRANLNNAYVTGMKEAVGFKGNDLSLAGSCFTAGYVVGQIPSSIILASGRITPRFWFPFCVFCWGFCTLGLAFVTNVKQVFAIRFVQALFEASTFSGTHYILGSWYKDSELGKRTAVFTSSAQFGSFFSGIMQGAIRQTLHGHHNKAGWQWMFIINFAMTIPIAFYGWAMFPDTPHNTKAFWLTEDERALCLRRLPYVEHQKITWASFRSSVRKAITNWRWYLFSALFMVSATSFEKTGIYAEFLLWLKSVKNADGTQFYSDVQVNYYSSLQTVVAIIGTYAMTVYCDATGHRFIANVIMYVSVLISSIMLLVWNIGTAGHFFAYSISGIGYSGQASNFAWANSMTRDDELLRSMTLFSMNLFSNLWNLWYQITVWPVSQAPKFRNGQIATIVTGAASVGIAAAIVYCSRAYPPNLPQDNEAAEVAEKGFDVAEEPVAEEKGHYVK